MATGSAEYEEVLGCLASLITQKVRADTGNRGNQWELMPKYVKVGGRRCVSGLVRVWLLFLLFSDWGVVALSDTRTGKTHSAVEGGSRCRYQREGKHCLCCQGLVLALWFGWIKMCVRLQWHS